MQKRGFSGGVSEVIVDELHKFLNDPRGTQLAGLLSRLNVLAPNHRRVGISATVPNPESPSKACLLRDPVYISGDSGTGSMKMSYHDWTGPEGLISTLRKNRLRKVVGFVRSRARAEELCHELNKGFLQGRCFPHHAAITSSRRRQVERCMRDWPTILVIATTTLEVGIDIGNIDATVLFDVPPDRESFIQRAGRSGRRSGKRRVLCIHGLYSRRTDYAEVLGHSDKFTTCKPFLSGVLQQIFSIFVQSPNLGFQELCEFTGESFRIAPEVLESLLVRMVKDRYIERTQDNRFMACEKFLHYHPVEGCT